MTDELISNLNQLLDMMLSCTKQQTLLVVEAAALKHMLSSPSHAEALVTVALLLSEVNKATRYKIRSGFKKAKDRLNTDKA